MRAFLLLILIVFVQLSHAQFKTGHYSSNSNLLQHTREIFINEDSTFTSEASYSKNIQPIWKGKWNVTNDTVFLSGLISYPYTGFNFTAVADSSIKGLKIEFRYSSGDPIAFVPVYIYCFDKEPIDTIFSDLSGIVFFSDAYLKKKKSTNTICYSIHGDSECNQTRLSQPTSNHFKITYEKGHPNPKQAILVEKYLITDNTLVPVNYLKMSSVLKEYILKFIDKSYR